MGLLDGPEDDGQGLEGAAAQLFGGADSRTAGAGGSGQGLGHIIRHRVKSSNLSPVLKGKALQEYITVEVDLPLWLVTELAETAEERNSSVEEVVFEVLSECVRNGTLGPSWLIRRFTKEF